MGCMKILLKVAGAIALVTGAQAVILASAIAVPPFQGNTANLFASQIATDILPEPIFSSETYQPPDNGGPTTSQGSGTR
jgi:hypothetical protein